MKKQYESKGIYVIMEEDVYSEGCQPDSISDYYMETDFAGDTIPEIIKAIKDFHEVDDDAVLLDSCDEVGRIEVQRLEDEIGCAASRREIAEWKEGKRKLFLANYAHYVELVTREAVSLIV